MSTEPFRDFIKARLGLHFGGEADAQLNAILATRMTQTGINDCASYLARAAADPLEFQRLTRLLTINETYFYREPQHLALLVDHLAPTLLANSHRESRRNTPIRILSVGCSTGEEPYSIAIALRERYGDSARQLFRILGGDVDQEAIDRARAGIYTAFSFRALPDGLRDRYFSAIDATHRQIDATLREQVRFIPWNLLAGAYPEEVRSQDIIFFRNVSIYFDEPTRKAVLTRLKALLKPGGHLIVGASETLANDFGLMRLHAREGVFLFAEGATVPEPVLGPAAMRHLARQPSLSAGPSEPRQHALRAAKGPVSSPTDTPTRHQRGTAAAQGSRQASGSRSIRPASDQTSATPPGSSTPSPPPDSETYAQALVMAHAERFDEALKALEPECAREDALVRHLTLQSHLFLERGDTQRAAAAAERALRQDSWSSDALLLLAHCARLRDDPQASIALLKRTIYDNPSCWRAHYQLAEIYRAAGEWDLATREYRILLRRLDEDPRLMQNPSELPCPLTPTDLRFLCETRLTRLVGATT
jgi:chemotaxis protein methyltransferase CheR